MVKTKTVKRSIAQTPETAHGRERNLVSSEFTALADDIIGSFTEYVRSGGKTEPKALLQKEAFTETSDAERDAILGKISERSGINVDLRLRNAEQTWRDAGHSQVMVEPWMKQGLGHDNPEVPSLVVGAKREIILHIDDDNRAYLLTELEIPHKIVTPTGVTDNLQRVLYVHNTQLTYS